jgi:hypothetical protein
MTPTCLTCGGNTFNGFVCNHCNIPWVSHLCQNEWRVMAEDNNSNIVNEPNHYTRWVIEPITFIMLNGFEFWRGNIVKYASRAGFKLYEGKTQEESEIIDLEKVIRYSEMRINQINELDKL